MRLPTLIIALFAVARPLHAQLSEAQPGARVRLEAPGVVAGRYEGTILTRTGDTLRVGGPNSQPLSVPIDRIAALEVSRGTSRSLGAQRGALWGSAVGLAFALVTIPSLKDCDYCGTSTSGEQTSFALTMALSGGLWGAGIGALIGRERWDRFELHRTSMALDPRTSAVRVAFRY